ncbi:MAG: DmsC/YnfH family molybdoenzyme membrane anchor subunit [Nitrospinota bacterium]
MAGVSGAKRAQQTAFVGYPLDFSGQWRMRNRVQRVWDIPHATWFTLMGIGGGVFVLSRLMGISHDLGLWFGLPAVDIVSFVVIGIGGLVLIADLGKPFRFIRALINVRTSWISRGAIADFVFLILATLLILPNLKIGSAMPLSALPWESEAISGLGRFFEFISIVAAIVVMFYAGAVLSDPKSIPYWNSPLVPAQFLLSSFAMSAGVLSLFFLAAGKAIGLGLVILEIIFVAFLLVSMLWHLATRRENPAKRESLFLLLRGRYKGLFLGLTLAAGTVLPLALSLFAAVWAGARGPMMGITAILLFIGGFYLRLLTLRVGIYPPMR